MNPHVVMIDLETLSLQHNAYILQIGVQQMDLRTGFGQKASWGVKGQEGRHIDPDTVRWWMKQDREVAAKVFNLDGGMPMQTINETWMSLAAITTNCSVWAAPSTFDLAVLKDLFGGKTPWSHRQGLCLKSVAALLDPTGELKPPENGQHHDAEADCEWQLAYLRRLYEKVSGAGRARSLDMTAPLTTAEMPL